MRAAETARGQTSRQSGLSLSAALATLAIVVGILLLVWGVHEQTSLESTLHAELRTGRPVPATVVEVRAGNDTDTYLVRFDDQGRSRQVWLTPAAGDPNLETGDEITVYTDGGHPPQVVTSDLLTNRLGSTALALLLICAGVAAMLVGCVGLVRWLRNPGRYSSEGS